MGRRVVAARKVLCFDRAGTVADWIAIDDGRFDEVGTGEPPSGDPLVKVDGVVLPGMIDAHVHLTSTGIYRNGLDCRDCRSIPQLLETIAGFVRQNSVTWIAGGSFDPGRNADPRMPDRWELDSVARDQVLMLVRADGHSSTLSSAALEALDLDRTLPGTELSDGGEPTGRLSNLAHYSAARRFFSSLPREEIRKAQVAACAAALERGVTSVHDMGGPSHDDFAVLMDSLDRLPIAVKAYLPTLDIPKALAASRDCVGGDLALDGSIGSRTAAMSKPYEDEDVMGSLYLEDEEVIAFFVEATRAGLQAGVHAIGDAAVDQAIRCMEQALLRLGPMAAAGARRLRHRIEHFECVAPAQIERASAIGMVASVQPAFDKYWGGKVGMYSERLGERAASMNPLSAMIRAGMSPAGGSDSPVTPLDPFLGIAAAIEHHERGFAVPFDLAVRMFTNWSAAAGHEELFRGSIEKGKFADFCVVDKDPSPDPHEEFPTLSVLETWVEGEVAYSSS